jgi:hypothetical protein
MLNGFVISLSSSEIGSSNQRIALKSEKNEQQLDTWCTSSLLCDCLASYCVIALSGFRDSHKNQLYVTFYCYCFQ